MNVLLVWRYLNASIVELLRIPKYDISGEPSVFDRLSRLSDSVSIRMNNWGHQRPSSAFWEGMICQPDRRSQDVACASFHSYVLGVEGRGRLSLRLSQAVSQSPLGAEAITTVQLSSLDKTLRMPATVSAIEVARAVMLSVLALCMEEINIT